MVAVTIGGSISMVRQPRRDPEDEAEEEQRALMRAPSWPTRDGARFQRRRINPGAARQPL
jgi:hypothetical protein